MTNNGTLKITSSAFEDGGIIPFNYTCEGEEINPPLRVENIPTGTQTFAIIMEDPDAPNGIFDHWLVWNIPRENFIEERRIPGINGKNSAGKTGYHGPCPPSGSHRYYFHVFALDDSLSIKSGSDRKTLEEAMRMHILAKGSLMGTYEKRSK
jgi:Raf kinase inhibitor-like YbhB/YbcL family protein